MKISRKKHRDYTLLKFDGELSIYSASQSRDVIFQDSDAWPEVLMLDLQGVEEVDTAGIQLLLLIDKLQRQRKGSVAIAKSCEQVDQVLALLDLTHHFTQEARP